MKNKAKYGEKASFNASSLISAMPYEKKPKKAWRRQLPLHFMILPGLVLILVYNYIPMAGITIAFQNFIPAKGIFGSQDWCGLDNFKYVFLLPGTMTVLWNTVYISFMKIIAGLLTPILIALLLNEIRKNSFKRGVQTLIYLPNFLSWVIFAGIIIDILSPSDGIVNKAINLFGIEPIYFLGDEKWFPFTMVITDVWKNFGFNTIVFLAALTAIDPTLYEACYMDGAGKWKQTFYVTLPGMASIIVLIAALNIGQILNAGFDQIFNLYSPQVYSTGDIIDTLVYRLGMINAQYGVATAVGLFKSTVSFGLISLSYYFAYRFANYRIF